VYIVTAHLEGPSVEHEEDFERFYEVAFGRIAGQLFVVTGDLQDAEDFTQEAFARASTRWSRLRTYDLPEAWVRRVALRLATDRFRQARRRLAALRRLDAEPRLPAVSVEALALAEELRALPLSWRKAIVLHYLVGLPVDQVARTLGVPAGTVKTWLGRGRRALAARLGEQQGAVHRD
jgi:RNA polymerase sigma-70 factor (ECF subfamily)